MPRRPLQPHGFFPGDEEALRVVKRAISKEVARHLERTRYSKGMMAYELGSSRAHVRRLLDAQDVGVTLRTLQRFAGAFGLRLEVRFVPRTSSRGRPSRRRPSSRRSSSPP